MRDLWREEYEIALYNANIVDTFYHWIIFYISPNDLLFDKP